ncbi:hypothetical protein [Chitinophaga costaii]|nr:hypothetical protein [Chitinophaga costaii]
MSSTLVAGSQAISISMSLACLFPRIVKERGNRIPIAAYGPDTARRFYFQGQVMRYNGWAVYGM